MTKQIKHLLSAIALFAFAFLALASAVNKAHYGSFNYNTRVEDMSDTRNYLEKNDGSKIYGEKITWKSGMLVKDQIKIDDQKFKMSEIRGYRNEDDYYIRSGNVYIKRIVRGKINVYVHIYTDQTTTTDSRGVMRTRTQTRAIHYAQVGDDGPLEVVHGQKSIVKLVQGCAAAVELADKSDKQVRKAIKKDGNYLNHIFEVYNNDCK